MPTVRNSPRHFGPFLSCFADLLLAEPSFNQGAITNCGPRQLMELPRTASGVAVSSAGVNAMDNAELSREASAPHGARGGVVC
jgi:hypothetical protein